MAYWKLTELVYLGIVLFFSLSLTLALTPVSIRLAFRYGFLDLPDKRKVHKIPTPRLGGLSIAFAMAITLLVNVSPSREVVSFLLGALLIVIFGLLDDKRGLNSKLKYLLQLLPAAIFVYGSGIYLTTFGNLLGFGEIKLGSLGPLVTIFCMAGVMNAINLSDGLDGLAAGKSLIASCYLFLFAYLSGHYLISIFTVTMFGTLLGFLTFNTYPARLFMGDTGSLLLGYTLSVVTVGIVQELPGSTYVKPISMAVVMALPVFDTLVVMGRRLIQGKSIFNPDKTHFHHLLLKAGFAHPTSVAIIYIVMFFFGTFAWLIRDLPDWLQFILALFVLFSIYISLGILLKNPILGQKSTEQEYILPRKNIPLSAKFFAFISLAFIIIFFTILLIFVNPTPAASLLCFSLAIFLIIVFPWRGNRKQMIVGHGLLYLCIFTLTCMLHLTNLESLNFKIIQSFFMAMAIAWALVVIMDFRFRLIVMPSTFELLLILFSFVFVGYAFSDAFGIDKLSHLNMLFPTLYSIIAYINLKAYSRRRCKLNRRIAIFIFGLLILIGIKGFI